MKTIEGTTINCFRGNKCNFKIIKKSKVENIIEPFLKNDKVIFTIKSNFGEAEPILRKIIYIEETKDAVSINLSKEDTLIGNLISDYVDYEYDVSVNDITILGHDESGAKIFRLYPSGSDDK